jgi:hypothetical protein
MKPSLAFPYNDPNGDMLPHLQAILPDLKAHFGRAYVCPPLSTRQNAEIMSWLEADNFFTIFPLDRPMQIGEHFAHLYLNAALVAEPDEIIHLAYLDRLSFALETDYREQFLADVDSLCLEDLPLIFHRSPAAWATHPQNYARLEGFVTKIGEQLFDKTLDYGWCHIVVRAGELREVMPKVTHPGLSMVAEMILYMQHHIHTHDVDWLAWEDPFLADRDPLELKTEREQSVDEYEKRLSYCLPMVEALVKFAKVGHVSNVT